MELTPERFSPPELVERDLAAGSGVSGLRRLHGDLQHVQLRSTAGGVPWGVLHLVWSDRQFPGLLFPSRWARRPVLAVGREYHVNGMVAFRDGHPVIRVLDLDGPVRSEAKAKHLEERRVDVSDRQVEMLQAAIKESLPERWAAWPGGYPDEVEAALIDAVLSIRASYGNSATTGVRGAVRRYRDEVGEGALNDLPRLAAFGPERLAQVMQNHQKTAGVLKANAIVDAATNLVASGVVRAADLDPKEHQRAYTSVHGLGGVTWEYFTMLLGRPGFKADTWLTRWVSQAVGAEKRLNSDQARALLARAAGGSRHRIRDVERSDVDPVGPRHLGRCPLAVALSLNKQECQRVRPHVRN